MRNKVAALEHLIVSTGKPAFIAIQEVGGADLSENSELAAVIARYGYAVYQRHRNNDATDTHNGAALLVRNDISAAEYEWKEATAWSSHCEAVSVQVFTPSGSFIVTSIYIHGGSTDTNGFARLLLSVRDDQVLLGDLNAHLPGSPHASTPSFATTRGRAVEAFIRDRGAMYPTPDGPTRGTPVKAADGSIELQGGSAIDYIIVGAAVFDRVVNAEPESTVLSPDSLWPSDHMPVVWSANIGLAGSNKLDWCARIAWHRVAERHITHFNKVFAAQLRHLGQNKRHRDMYIVELALVAAARKALPWTRPRSARDGLFWLKSTQEEVQGAVDKCAPGEKVKLTKAYAAARRATLAENAEINKDPGSIYQFIAKYYAFKRGAAQLKMPLQLFDDNGDPLDPIFDPQQRVEALGKSYASVHGNPLNVDAQRDLREVLESIPDDTTWDPVNLTELKVAVASLNTGKCADFLSIRAEHIRMLDDDALKAMLPFVDRCLQHSAMPHHWRSAVVARCRSASATCRSSRAGARCR